MSSSNTPKVSFNTAIAIVIANMIGTGVFTSLGYQAVSVPSVFPLLMLWLVGGIVALCGALSYGELAAMMPRSGGEYHYLSKIYHPAFGFLSGWVSATVGFAAPVALAAMALGRYASSVYPAIDSITIGIIVVVMVTIIHATDIKSGSIFQRYSTLVKVLLIIFFIVSGLLVTSTPQNISVLPKEGDWELIFSSGFAISLAFVSFAYSGWNASAYLANEVEKPQKNVPLSLLSGTLVVMVCYIILNYVFLYTVPVSELASKQAVDFNTPLDVGYISADVIFGSIGGKIMGGMIVLLLVSSISAMVFAGPRVSQVMGEDVQLLKILAEKNRKNIPVKAVIFQSSISIVLILTSSFDNILYALAFILDLFTFSTVLGLFVMRVKQPNVERKYKAWGYPVTPFIFLLGTGWAMFYMLKTRTVPSLIAVGLVLLGLIVFYIDQRMQKEKKTVKI